MKKYRIMTYAKPKEYMSVVYSMGYESPVEYLTSIESDLKGFRPGKILFDLLLCNGYSSNRFLSAEFNGEQIDIHSFEIVPGTSEMTSRAKAFYIHYPDAIDNSVLSDKDMKDLKRLT